MPERIVVLFRMGLSSEDSFPKECLPRGQQSAFSKTAPGPACFLLGMSWQVMTVTLRKLLSGQH